MRKERSLYTFEFKLKVLKDLYNGQLAVFDVKNEFGIHKSFLTKCEKEEKHIISYVTERTKNKLLKKG